LLYNRHDTIKTQCHVEEEEFFSNIYLFAIKQTSLLVIFHHTHSSSRPVTASKKPLSVPRQKNRHPQISSFETKCFLPKFACLTIYYAQAIVILFQALDPCNYSVIKA